MSGIFDSFGRFIEQDRKKTPCVTCQFFASHPDEEAAIREQIAKRGLFRASGRPSLKDSRVRLSQVAAYIEQKFPEANVKYHNVIDHFRTHEEAI